MKLNSNQCYEDNLFKGCFPMTNGNFVELMIIEIETNNPAKILPQISPCVIKFEEDDVHKKCYSCGKTGNMHRILKYKVVLWRAGADYGLGTIGTCLGPPPFHDPLLQNTRYSLKCPLSCQFFFLFFTVIIGIFSAGAPL